MTAKSILLSGLFFFGFFLLKAQEDERIKYGETITRDDLYSYLSVLASDSLEGRETGKPGQKKAAEFIKSHFMEFGLIPPVDSGYFQTFELQERNPGKSEIRKGKKTIESGKDFLMSGELALEDAEMELVFVGNGTDEELDQLELDGKAVAFFYKGNASLRSISKAALERGAKVSFGIGRESREDFRSFRDLYTPYFTRPSLGFPSEEDADEGLRVYTHLDFVADLLEAEPNKLKDYSLYETFGKSSVISISRESESKMVPTENVLGYIEGSDKKEELIVLTAHYDHEGIINGKIYNGADDDASGTSAIMEIAEAFAIAKEQGHGPRRSMLFMAVTAEEKGLYGSQYYSDNPVFPLENTVTNLNIDMIGRQDEKHISNPDYVYLIGTKMLSDELHDLSEDVNDKYSKLQLDYTYNDKDDPNRFYYRSDHYNFAKHNIPVIFYFNGTHEDYHQPSDTLEKINFRKLEKISRFVFYTAWELANRENRVALNE